MNKDIGYYYNLKGEFSNTILQSVDIENETPLYLVLAYSIQEEKSEIHFINVQEQRVAKTLVIYTSSNIITQVKFLNIKNKQYIFGIGFQNKESIGKESFYFYQEIKMENFDGNIYSLDMKLKIKKTNFKSLDVIDHNVYLTSDDSIYRYSFNELRLELFYELYNKSANQKFNYIKTDPKNKRLYLALQNNVLILEEDLSNNFSIDSAHDLCINQIDINSNKNNQILTTANENFLKFWDVRYPQIPNLIIQENTSLITSASFNHFYDQLVLYSVENGSLFLTGANSISSSIMLKLNENENIPDNKLLKFYESALDDHINNIQWNVQDAWIFGAVSDSKIYFDSVAQKTRFDVMFQLNLK